MKYNTAIRKSRVAKSSEFDMMLELAARLLSQSFDMVEFGGYIVIIKCRGGKLYIPEDGVRDHQEVKYTRRWFDDEKFGSLPLDHVRSWLNAPRRMIDKKLSPILAQRTNQQKLLRDLVLKIGIREFMQQNEAAGLCLRSGEFHTIYVPLHRSSGIVRFGCKGASHKLRFAGRYVEKHERDFILEHGHAA